MSWEEPALKDLSKGQWSLLDARRAGKQAFWSGGTKLYETKAPYKNYQIGRASCRERVYVLV